MQASEAFVQQLLRDNGLKRTGFVSPLTQSSKTLCPASKKIFTTFENKSRFGFWVFYLGIAHR
jgi:hypothetical protein